MPVYAAFIAYYGKNRARAKVSTMEADSLLMVVAYRLQQRK